MESLPLSPIPPDVLVLPEIRHLAESPSELIEKLTVAQGKMLQLEQARIPTEHVIHGGMYSRTVSLEPDTILIGPLIKVPTLLITAGSGIGLVGTGWVEFNGYQVLPGSAGRKILFIARSAFVATMIFPTSAKTVEEAEAEFTDEHDILLSHQQMDLNTVTITGE